MLLVRASACFACGFRSSSLRIFAERLAFASLARPGILALCWFAASFTAHFGSRLAAVGPCAFAAHWSVAAICGDRLAMRLRCKLTAAATTVRRFARALFAGPLSLGPLSLGPLPLGPLVLARRTSICPAFCLDRFLATWIHVTTAAYA